MNIEIISASAGSGKTYTLAELLEKNVQEGKVRPEAILATTFTKRAAAELQERVRTRLLTEGLSAPAQQLAASRIGTVNSVCGRLLADFSFELGISPFQKVLSEDAAKMAINHALARVVSAANQQEIVYLQQVFEEIDVRAVIGNIVSKARVNGLDSAALLASGKASIDGFKNLLGTPNGSGQTLDSNLTNGLDYFLTHVDTDTDTTKKTATTLQFVRAISGRLHNGGTISWATWLKLAKLDLGKKSLPAAAPLRLAAEAQDQHPRLHEDTNRLITIVFELAALVLESYKEYKREWGVVDFVDQEVLTLRLLTMETIQEQLRTELDLVLVDEFQDTSPIQIAIFLKLASLAKQSVWVGDQKQAIYGFRDADPALMDTAIVEILKGHSPRTLDKSWRSRPDLVRSTSDVFVHSFAKQGYLEENVRLDPANSAEPAGLNSIYECWQLESKNKGNDALALASTIKEFLADMTRNSIRDPMTGEKRYARGGDIAVLCRENDACVAVAEALEQQGVKAALPRNGLLAQPEIIFVLAALRLLIDPKDSLAKAEIARIIDNPADHNAWLQKALSSEWATGFDLDIFGYLEKVREAFQFSGPLEMLDRAIDATDVRSFCLQWGTSEARIANLDTLRIHCVKYVDQCQSEGRGASPAGFVVYLDNLTDDTQAVVSGDDSVTVMTWHRSKGLEWPVTILFQLDKVYKGKAIGVSVVSDQEFDLNSPLAGRWVRYWPYPYGKQRKGSPLHDRLAIHSATVEAEDKEERQELRLLYVGWTRARDKVIFAGRKGFLTKGILQLLVNDKGNHLLEPPVQDKATWAGREVEVILRAGAPQDPITPRSVPGTGYKTSGERGFPIASMAASKMMPQGAAGKLEQIGNPLPVSGKPDPQSLGEAIHTFFAADYNSNRDQDKRLLLAEKILHRWSMASSFSPEAMLTASDKLYKWVAGRWPNAVWHREWPMELKLEEGTIIRGFIDLVLEIPEGYVVIDHKSFHVSQEFATAKAASYGGQLWAYGEAINQVTDKKVIAHLIHFPIMGVVVPIKSQRCNKVVDNK